MEQTKIRLFVDQALSEGQSVTLDKNQAHYLFVVMRLTVDARVLIFNGVAGEFLASVSVASKRNGILLCEKLTKPLQMPSDLWLIFAPIKKSRTDFIVEKATEMGVSRIIPILTEHTNNDRIRQEKLQAHAIEAAEQCGGTFVPEVSGLQKFDNILGTWPNGRRLLFCDETLVGANKTIDTKIRGPWAIIIGPEGGFSKREREFLRAMSLSNSISLGPRILRADTAAVAALTIWQSTLGDW